MYIFISEPVSGNFGWAVHNKGLGEGQDDGTNEDPVVAVVDEAEKEEADGVHDGADSEADSDAFGVDEIAGGEVHDGSDEEGDLDGEVGVGFGEAVDFGDFAGDGDDSVVGEVVDGECD
jgi:hypothetical protein